MDYHLMMGSWYFTYLMVPLFIMFARICDVTIGTMRIIFISRGKKNLAPFLGFFEVIIWVVAMGQVMQNLNNPITYLAYGFGFAAGNYVGMMVEEKLAIGHAIIRIISNKDMTEIVNNLIEIGCGVTSLEGAGARGKVNIILTVIDRSNMDEVLSIIERNDEHIFYSIEDAKGASWGVFPNRRGYVGTIFKNITPRQKSHVRV